MSLAPGTRLGPYEILAPIGAGGMGEVYRARDAKLNRDVALKVLAEAFASDPDRVARFRREAQVLAALNHPNIGHIYGFEDSGATHALVLELVDGPTLADRLAHGPIPLADALPIARQIADALEAAHEQSIVHRDLKPANIKVRADGTVKVLDFGLAKALGAEPVSAATDAMNSPTVTNQATSRGVILGTAAYMAPEQARGQPVDKEADIWAFGCVLYEMLTGHRTFAGTTVADLLAAVLRAEIDWQRLPAATPPTIRRLLRRCLERDPKRRLRDIGDARLELDEREDARVQAAPTRPRGPLVWMLATAAAAIVVTAIAMLVSFRASPSAGVTTSVRAIIPLPAQGGFDAARSNVAISPDGRTIVYTAFEGSLSRLYRRPLDRFEPAPIQGTDGGEGPFFAPDGQRLGFLADGKLKQVALDGGSPLTICDAPDARGASWGPDDWIVFTPSYNDGLWRVRASGGAPVHLTALDAAQHERTHRFPHLLPDGRAVLYMVGTTEITSYAEARIMAQPIAGGAPKIIVQGGMSPQYAAGRLVYNRGDALMAVPFDAARLEVTGSPVTIAEGVATNGAFGVTHFALAPDGTLIYIPGGETSLQTRLVWVDRTGAQTPFSDVTRVFRDARISPDGMRLLVGESFANDSLWTYDIRRLGFSRLTFHGEVARGAWTRDGRRVVCVVGTDVVAVAADGSSSDVVETLYADSSPKVHLDVSADGDSAVFDVARPGTGWDIWMLSLKTRKATPWLATRFSEGQPRFSPDSRWIAYSSDETGRAEVFVRASSGSGTKSQISTNGGVFPVWSRDGHELFFERDEELYVADVSATASFGLPRRLLKMPPWRALEEVPYDVTPDGRRFIMIETLPAPVPKQINVIFGGIGDARRK